MGTPTDDTALPTHRGTRAVQRMVEYAPSTGGLALWVHHRDVAEGEGADLIATDGKTIYYGPRFERLSLDRQVGLVAHEVLHIALRHAQRYGEMTRVHGDIDQQLYNICADAIVNSTLGHLGWLKLPDSAVMLEDLLARVLLIRQDVEKSLLEWDVERLYRAIDDRSPTRGISVKRRTARRASRGRRSSGQPLKGRAERDALRELAEAHGDGSRSARVRLLGEDIVEDLVPSRQSDSPEEEVEAAREWRERVTRAHAGDGAYSMLRSLIADLPKTRTPWEYLLRTQLTRALAMQRGLSWSRPSRSYIANRGRAGTGRRMPWEPGYSSAKATARLVVMIDVSGSIPDRLLERFANEIETISRRTEAGLTVIVGDNRVRHVESFEPGRSNLRQLSFQGGGGTDFSPLLEAADRLQPDIGVVLTDLRGPSDFRPTWPVLWAVPSASADIAEPFGRKLVLD